MRVLVAPLQRLLFHRTSSLADHWAFHCCHSTWLGATAAHAATLARPVTPRQPTGWKRLRRFAGLASSLGHRHRCSEYLQGDPGCPTGRLPAEAGHSNYRRVAPRLAHETSDFSPRTATNGCLPAVFGAPGSRTAGGFAAAHSLSSAWYELSLKIPLSNAPPALPSLSVPRGRTPLRCCAGGEKKKRDASCDARPPPRPAVAQAPHWPALTISRGTRGQTPPCT